MEENWESVEGYEGLYEVSDRGRVRSLDRVVEQLNWRGDLIRRGYKGRILKHRLAKNGYPYLHLSKSGTSKTVKVHRLVALAFIPNPEGKPEVNHIDGDKVNNNKDNLEWVTPSENKKHAIATGLKVNPSGPKAHNYRGDVLVIDSEGNVVETLRGHADIIRKGFSSSGVSAVLRGRSKTHKGFKFKLKENEK